MRAAKVGALVMLSVSLFSAAATADETKPPAPAEKPQIVVPEHKIYGRRQHPTASVDVARLVPRAPLPDLRKPLVDRIGQAVEKAPF